MLGENHLFESGVRQWCPLSPVLTNFAVDSVPRRAADGYQSVQVSTDLHYAPRIRGRLSGARGGPDHFSSGSPNTHRRLVLRTIPSDSHASRLLQINVQTVESISDFQCLGPTILPNNEATDFGNQRIGSTRMAFLQRCTFLATGLDQSQN